MPKLIMVSDYIKNPTHAGNYLAYMSRQGDLICHNGNTTLAESMSALEENQESIMWRQVVSLEREDCERLNLDHDYFMNLIVARSDEIAKIYNISPENLKIYASFHNKDYHPHLHMLFYSTNKNEGFIKGFAEDKERGMKQATTKLKSLFANEIFKEDLHYLKVNKSSTRTLMNEQVKEILQGMTKNEFIPKELVQEYKELSGALKLHFVENPTQRKVYM
ncbi:MAG: relaxase MobL, partial [Oscillospiraceae bacterium]|nr:relaxase MobL [Oscillospiraceae bacterium]